MAISSSPRLAQRLLLLLVAVTTLLIAGVSANPLPESHALATVEDRAVAEPAATLEDRGIEKRSFLISCVWFSLTGGNTLHASCRKSNGEFQDTSLNLDNCIVNSFGRLQWGAGGTFSRSCNNIGLRTVWWDDGATGELWLKANCGNGSGGTPYTELDLDVRIHNFNGNLGCGV